MSKNRLRIHACGGGGTNVALYIQNKQVINGGAVLEYHFLDTSDDLEIKDVQGRKHKVQATQVKGSEVIGSGGDRATNKENIKASIIEYANATVKDPRTIEVIISSGSGGSGGPMAGFLTKEFVDKGHPVFVILVTDTTNDKYLDNSLTALATLSKISTTLDKNITILELVNTPNEKLTALEVIEHNNEKAAITLKCLSIMFSGTHSDLDTQDVTTMFNTSNYNGTGIPKGLLYSSFHYGNTDGLFVLSRTIVDNDTFDKKTILPSSIHDKVGSIAPELLDVFNKLTNSSNLSLVLESNKLKASFDFLKDEAVKRKKVVRHDDVVIDGMDEFLDMDI